jgi:hypothetical protein
VRRRPHSGACLLLTVGRVLSHGPMEVQEGGPWRRRWAGGPRAPTSNDEVGAGARLPPPA